MSPVDRYRIRLAAWWYGAWLEYHGLPGRRRKELKGELRANLIEASAATSTPQAIRDLGGVRALAASVARDGTKRPRWQLAAVASAVAFGLSLHIELIGALNYVSGVRDSGGGDVTGSVFPFPGSVVTHEPQASGFAVAVSPGWFPFALAALVLVLVARPWRMLRRRQPAFHARVGVGHD